MTTTLNPPPVAGDPPPPPPTRGSSRVVATLLIVFGGLVVLGAVLSTVISAIAAASVQTTARTVDVTGITNLDVDVAAGSLRIEFADVDAAQLEVTGAGGADRWTLRTEEGELVVASPDHWWGAWPFGDGGAGEGTLLLPESMKGADADLSLAAGDLVVAGGVYREIDLDMGAGRARIEASATELSADVSAGTADLDVDGAREASLTVSAGSLEARLTGRQPQLLDLEVSAGTLEVTVPDGQYDVTSDVSAGTFDNRIGSTPGASSTVTVEVSAGKATLRAD